METLFSPSGAEGVCREKSFCQKPSPLALEDVQVVRIKSVLHFQSVSGG